MRGPDSLVPNAFHNRPLPLKVPSCVCFKREARYERTIKCNNFLASSYPPFLLLFGTLQDLPQVNITKKNLLYSNRRTTNFAFCNSTQPRRKYNTSAERVFYSPTSTTPFRDGFIYLYGITFCQLKRKKRQKQTPVPRRKLKILRKEESFNEVQPLLRYKEIIFRSIDFVTTWRSRKAHCTAFEERISVKNNLNSFFISIT